MKKLLFLTILILMGVCLQAQKNCKGKDAVHPTQFRKSILDCCIQEIKEGNEVVYIKKNKVYEIEAVAINVNGSYIDLVLFKDSISNIMLPNRHYRWNNYDYFESQYKNAKKSRNLGIGLIIGGVGLTAGGVILTIYGLESMMDGSSPAGFTAGIITSLGGTVLFFKGISIGATAKNNRIFYKNAMEQSQKNKNLSFGITNNGVGLVLNF